MSTQVLMDNGITVEAFRRWLIGLGMPGMIIGGVRNGAKSPLCGFIAEVVLGDAEYGTDYGSAVVIVNSVLAFSRDNEHPDVGVVQTDDMWTKKFTDLLNAVPAEKVPYGVTVAAALMLVDAIGE